MGAPDASAPLFAVTLLSLVLVAIGHLAFALQIAAADAITPSSFFWEGEEHPRWYDPGHLAIAMFLTWGVFLFTWKVYVPCAVITGWATSFLLHRRVRATAGALPPVTIRPASQEGTLPQRGGAAADRPK